MENLIIIGAGGFGREVLAWAAEAIEHGREWTIKGLLDDNPQALDGFTVPAPWLGAIATYRPDGDDVFVCAIGALAAKRRCVDLVRANGGRFASLTHRTAVLGQRVRRGAGVILCPHSIVSSDATLEDFVTVNYHSTVAHDAIVGAYSQLHCHVDVTGGVRIGRGVLLGSHASILPGIVVGDGATVGAGSLVTRDVPAGTTVFGNPARLLPPPR